MLMQGTWQETFSDRRRGIFLQSHPPKSMFPLLTTWRRRALRRGPTPPEWTRVLNRIPLYRRLPPEDRRELESHMRVFLAEKHFEGAQGVVVTIEMQLRIAATACVLLLHRRTDYYPDLRTIIVYPGAFLAPRHERRGTWIETERTDVLSGESWGDGVVILSWDDVKASEFADDGVNLVLHEFAHQLDEEDGNANGAPILGSTVDPARWAEVMRNEYETLRAAAARGEETLLDPYGAETPAEFFAVATETFFERGAELEALHPTLYEQFRLYYQQHPAAWPKFA
jgi:Mlc titration factor MtfA (ptsG expression regulator)